MKKILIVVALTVSAALTIAGCGGSGGGGTTPTTSALKGLAACIEVATEAVICGTALAADGVTPIIGATVSQVTSGASVSLTGLYNDVDEGGFFKGVASDTECLTDTSGEFACSGLAASGSTNFQLTKEGIGTKAFSATVTVGETTDIPAADTTVSELTAKWLVVPGMWDGVQLLLSQMKGCTLTGDESDPVTLRTSTECEALDLFVVAMADVATTFASVDNITTYDSIFINCGTDMSAYSTVLQEYVGQGGNLYFSDLADTGLTTAFSGNVNFGTSVTTGDDVNPIVANVDNTGLATFLGSNTVEVLFNIGSWQTITSVESNVATYISGDTSTLGGTVDAPITVGWKEGSGGCIFYTSYHIEGASTGSAQELALKYLVLNVGSVCE
jgi:hypothetical protein